MTAPPANRFKASCTLCGANFVQSGADLAAILSAYKAWDAEHTAWHASQETTPETEAADA